MKYMHQRHIHNVGGGIPGLFHTITSIPNLFLAWKEFKRGKRRKRDVQEFEFGLEDNLFLLHELLVSKRYTPGPYGAFLVRDPKLRHIHKASVHDRVVHQALFRIINPIFDKYFIFDSFSSRLGKGTHKGIERLNNGARKITGNWKKSAYYLKSDIRKYFDSIDHGILKSLIQKRIHCSDTMWLVEKIIDSYKKEEKCGIPLGNVTSQLFGNVYLNELDQFVKNKLKIKHYFRYCDDIIILCDSKEVCFSIKEKIENFLCEELRLDFHPRKIIVKKIRQGIDFLGYVTLPYYRKLRTKTKKRILKKIEERYFDMKNRIITEESFQQSIQSYFGILKHCKGHKTQNQIEEFNYRNK